MNNGNDIWNEIENEQKDKDIRAEEYANILKLTAGNKYEITVLEDTCEIGHFAYEGRNIKSYRFKIKYLGVEKVLSITSNTFMRNIVNFREEFNTLKDLKLTIIVEGNGLDRKYTLIPKLDSLNDTQDKLEV